MILHVRDLESIFAQVDHAVPARAAVRPDAPRRERPQYLIPAGQGRVLHRLPHSAGHQPRDVLASAREILEAWRASWRDVDITTVDQCARVARNPAESEVVLTAVRTVFREIYGIEPHCDGMRWRDRGRGLPRHGHPAAVWACVVTDLSSRQRYSLISRTIGDAQVLARMLFDLGDDEDWEGEPF